MKRPQLIAQSSLNRMLQSAKEAWERHDFQQCFELLERANRLNPANPRVLMLLAQAFGRRYDYAAAERYFEQAVRVGPKKAEILATGGRLFIDFGRPQLAERYFQRALEQPDATSDTFARLAEFYERLHRADDAATLVERALHRDNACPLARLVQARLHRQAGRLTEAEQVLRPILTAANREFRIRGFYELGAIHDQQGRYDEAMSAFLEAKLLLQPDAPPLLAQVKPIIRRFSDMRDGVSREMLARWFDSRQELVQPARRIALLTGHARSGTTLLEQMLDSHPEIISAEETSVFQEDVYATLQHNLPPGTPMLAGLNAASVQVLCQARERYFQSVALWLGQPPGERLLIDKNPAHLVMITAFVRIFPEARLIVALRDPRDVVLSCFMLPHYPLSAGNVSSLELETTVRAYTHAMGIWQTLKPLVRNSWLEVRYEDTVEDLASVARKTLDFLAVPWDARVLGFNEYARQKMVRSPSYADVTQPVYKRARGRWRNYRKYFEPHLAALEPFVKAFGYE